MKLWVGMAAIALLSLAGCEGDDDACFLRDRDGACVLGSDDFPWFDAGGDGSVADAAVDASGLDGGSDAATETPVVGLPVRDFCREMLTVAVAWRDLFNSPGCACPREPDATAAESLAIRTRFLETMLAYSEMSPAEDAEGKCIRQRTESIDQKRVRYDGRNALVCATTFRQQFAGAPVPVSCPVDLAANEARIAHGAQTLVQIPVCREAFVGLVAEGRTCVDQLDCLQGLRCIPVVGSTDGLKSCQRARSYQGLSEVCTRNSDCVDGAICSVSGADHRCIPVDVLKSPGGNCDFSFECETGYVCNDEGRCAMPTIVAVCGGGPTPMGQ